MVKSINTLRASGSSLRAEAVSMVGFSAEMPAWTDTATVRHWMLQLQGKVA